MGFPHRCKRLGYKHMEVSESRPGYPQFSGIFDFQMFKNENHHPAIGVSPIAMETLKANGLSRRVGPRLRCRSRCLAGARIPTGDLGQDIYGFNHRKLVNQQKWSFSKKNCHFRKKNVIF